MRRLFFCFIFIASIVGISFQSHAVSNCTLSGGEIGTSGATSECYANSGEMRVTLYRIALCTTGVTYANHPEKCETIYNNDAGVQVEIGPSKLSTQIGSSISIPEGTYNNAMILVDETIEVKGTYVFDRPMKGRSNVASKTCWTLAGSKESTYSTMASLPTDCGTNPQPGWLRRTYAMLYDVTTSTVTNSLENLTNPTGTYAAYAAATSTTLTNGSNTDFLIGLQSFDRPVVITPNTNSVALDFLVTNMFHVKVTTTADGVHSDCGVGANGCMVWAIPRGFEFSMSTN